MGKRRTDRKMILCNRKIEDDEGRIKNGWEMNSGDGVQRTNERLDKEG